MIVHIILRHAHDIDIYIYIYIYKKHNSESDKATYINSDGAKMVSCDEVIFMIEW